VSNRRRLRGGPAPQMPPHVRAVADQAATADGQVRGTVRAIMDAACPGSRFRQSGRVAYEVTSRLTDLVLARQLGLCPHLSWKAPAPAFWSAWAPGRLECLRCSSETAGRVCGTEEDRTCDACGRYDPDGVHPGWTVLPAMVGFDGACLPSIAATLGLCDACLAADRQPWEPPPAQEQARQAARRYLDGPHADPARVAAARAAGRDPEAELAAGFLALRGWRMQRPDDRWQAPGA